MSYKSNTETHVSNTAVDIPYFPKHCRCQARRVVLLSGAFIPATFGAQGGSRSTFNQQKGNVKEACILLTATMKCITSSHGPLWRNEDGHA